MTSFNGHIMIMCNHKKCWVQNEYSKFCVCKLAIEDGPVV